MVDVAIPDEHKAAHQVVQFRVADAGGSVLFHQRRKQQVGAAHGIVTVSLDAPDCFPHECQRRNAFIEGLRRIPRNAVCGLSNSLQAADRIGIGFCLKPAFCFGCEFSPDMPDGLDACDRGFYKIPLFRGIAPGQRFCRLIIDAGETDRENFRHWDRCCNCRGMCRPANLRLKRTAGIKIAIPRKKKYKTSSFIRTACLFLRKIERQTEPPHRVGAGAFLFGLEWELIVFYALPRAILK